MNILPKKSWHVRSRQNIERVKRDEAQAAEENKKREERAALAEQEARTALLRGKARKLTASHDQEGHLLSRDAHPDAHPNENLAVQVISDNCAGSGHVDLFSELSSEKPEGIKNKEHEKEEKAAKEKYEQKIGLLTYLGQSSAEAQIAKPWYFKAREQTATTDSELDKQSCADLKRKANMDPMADMVKYLGLKRTKGGVELPKTKSTWNAKGQKSVHTSRSLVEDTRTAPSQTVAKQVSSEGEKQKHHKYKSKHKHKHDKERKSARTKKEKKRERTRREEPQGPSLQQLREERLRREAVERAKTNRLLSGEKQDSDKKQESEENMDRPGRYNSQFHPELARNRHRKSEFSLV